MGDLALRLCVIRQIEEYASQSANWEESYEVRSFWIQPDRKDNLRGIEGEEEYDVPGNLDR